MTSAPVVVLVRPQLGENIGACARAMFNFGLTDLRLVSPRDGWPNPDAGPSAAGADVVLAGAQVHDSVAGAVADCGFVYATTVRHRGMTKPVVSPRVAAETTRQRPGRTAILFGAERSGLESDDVALAHAILTVPVNPAFKSLNLAQAVILTAYEWHVSAGDVPETIDNYDGPAAHASLEGLLTQIDTALESANYYSVPDRVKTFKRTVRNLFTRPAYSEGEVRTLRGIVHSLSEGRRGKSIISD